MAKQVRAITFAMLMRLLRSKKKKLNDDSLVLEVREDHSGCIKSGATLDIWVQWNDLFELNEILKEDRIEDE